MANTIQLKRTAYNAGGVPSSLSYGELAWDNLNENVFYIDETILTISNTIYWFLPKFAFVKKKMLIVCRL